MVKPSVSLGPSGAFGKPDKTTWLIVALGGVSVGLLLLPVVTNPIPPLMDYAGHLARIHVLYSLIHGTAFTDMFTYRFAVVPNLAIDGFVLGLMQLGVGIEAAGRIFLGLSLLAMSAGVIGLHYANFRRLSVWPLIALPFFYHDMFFGGLLNYFFGVGLAFVGAAGWEIGKRDRPILALCGLALCSVLLFFCHLVAQLLLIGIVVATELSELFVRGPLGGRGNFRRLPAVLLATCLPLGLMALSPLTSGTEPPSLASFVQQLTWAGLRDRFVVLRNFTWAYDGVIDKLSLLILLAVGGLALMAGRLRVDWRRLLPIAGLLVVFLLIPDFWFGTYYIPNRLPIALFMLAVASTDVVPAQRMEFHALAAVIALLTLVRGAVVEQAWLTANAAFRPVLAALDTVPPGTRIYSAIAYTDFAPVVRVPIASLPGYAVIRRNAYYAGVYALPSQNLVYRLPAYADASFVPVYQVGHVSKWLRPDDPYNPRELAFFDLVLVINPALWPARPPSALVPVVRGEDYVLLRIPHAPVADQPAKPKDPGV